MVQVILHTGEMIKGNLIEESDSGIKINSSMGDIFFSFEQIKNYDFIGNNGMDPSSNSIDRWNYSDEELIDIFFDPTGYTLTDNTFYLSGFSWGYGVTDKIQFTSNWLRYADGDVNFRPKIQIFKKGNVYSEMTGSVGGHIHYRGFPEKFVYEKNEKSGKWVNIGDTKDTYSGDDPWVELFGSVTKSNLRSTGKGRMNFTAGGSMVIYSNIVMPRVYGAFTSDVRKNIKLIVELFYDPYFPGTYEFLNDKEQNIPIGWDFGYIWSYNDQFRIGIHYQRPFLAIYYKF